jgi:hypothetical protein
VYTALSTQMPTGVCMQGLFVEGETLEMTGEPKLICVIMSVMYLFQTFTIAVELVSTCCELQST